MERDVFYDIDGNEVRPGDVLELGVAGRNFSESYREMIGMEVEVCALSEEEREAVEAAGPMLETLEQVQAIQDGRDPVPLCMGTIIPANGGEWPQSVVDNAHSNGLSSFSSTERQGWNIGECRLVRRAAHA